jgi:hypothetical protein
MVTKELSVKVVLFTAVEVCPTPRCARRRETFYNPLRNTCLAKEFEAGPALQFV